ncbi:pyruvate/2-oxoglutarate dehydrogenase complex, dihydrolipoamide acyltransferase (E2) component [Anaerolinea thermolimosa]|uniref:dihydrolipoamide acetyltransferase family protein n=1 Tax=Anaerolinea thermolimosa TaxID=229919 RepID=UPI0007848D27|nr:dihydrolipoamide acetyltransferase family protein [Anaerolinea thermolimosa]GAP05862.1 pyruvate/2-oxoglutarate dehydrogenase complex, dihydrolipoamide acyltransferase (E2) component [Anaerolinea thermolimosa]
MAEIVTMPKLGFDMQEGTLVRWVRVEGEAVEKGQVLAEIETDKATVEVESVASGIVYKHLVEQGSVVPVGTPIAVIAAPGEQVTDLPGGMEAPAAEKSAVAEVPVEAEAPAALEVSGETGRIKASPLARRLALEKGVDLAGIRGSGPGGRIVRKDIEAALAAAAQPVPAAVIPPEMPPAPAVQPPVMPLWSETAAAPQDERLPIGKLRAAIGRRMVESKQQLPHFYVTASYNVEALMALRSQLNAFLPEGQKLTVNDFIIKATALTLREFRNLNASIVEKEIIRHGHINIGVAVAVEGGLLTIVCRDADLKPLRLISSEVRDLALRARSGKVRPEDIEGSTFSISNLGMFDVENFGAIINPPEAAILAVGTAQKVPVVEGDEVRVGMRMKATLSADHRVTDGAEAAQFMQALRKYLEEPLRLLL